MPQAYPPETLEGWYSLHQTFRLSRGWEGDRPKLLERAVAEAMDGAGHGWSIGARLVGSPADLLLMHLRADVEELTEAGERAVEELAESAAVRSSVLGVTEAGLYNVTSELAKEVTARGGQIGDEAHRAATSVRVGAERESALVKRRLFPELPSAMPWVSFYPMSKRRCVGQNWYELPLDERSALMRAHGSTGRRYTGRVQQIITGSIGFNQWEWGVTLFAADPLDIKRIVTDMRFDEVSARYAEFGEFFVGRVVAAKDVEVQRRRK